VTVLEVVQGVEDLAPDHGPMLAVVGVFDGIHLGHRYLLEHLVHESRGRGARP
jgi:FAD synthase